MQEDIQVIILVVGGTVLLLLLVGIVIVSILFYQRAQNNHAKKLQELENTYQQEVLRAQLEVKETTLNAIAREIHDNIGQVLALIKLNLNFIPAAEGSPEMENVYNTKLLVSKAITDLRNLSKSLNADYILDQPIDVLIKIEVDALQKTGQYEAKLEVHGNAYKIESKKHLILFRMVQELISNVLRHSKATTINIQLSYSPVELRISIKDNGIGYHPSEAKISGGTGIKNILYRATLIDAIVNFESKSGSGTLVTISLRNE